MDLVITKGQKIQATLYWSTGLLSRKNKKRFLKMPPAKILPSMQNVKSSCFALPSLYNALSLFNSDPAEPE